MRIVIIIIVFEELTAMEVSIKKRLLVNKIITVYGKNNISRIVDAAIMNNELIYYD